MELSHLKLEKHNIFGSTSIALSKDASNSKNKKTIFIGPNGAGKSNLLECIADALTIEYSLDKAKAVKSVKYEYELTIKNNKNHETISNTSNSISPAAKKLLAITANSQDRFPFINNNSIRKSSEYCYLGMKTTTNNIFFSTLKESILVSLFTIYGNSLKIKSTKEVLKLLGFAEQFEASLKKGTNYKLFLEKILEGKDVESKGRFDSKSFNKYLNIEFENKYINWSKQLEQVLSKAKYLITVDLNDTSKYEYKISYLAFISDLLTNNVISIDKLSLFSANGYDMNQASSGEFNILKIFLSIIANVSDNTVILIDEPEISLHPNWQMAFPQILDLALSNYSGCHSIIATHSHFILSNVSNDDSLILTLNPTDNSREVIINELNIDAYGWSPEQILYRVFGITANRNMYLELDLRIIVDFISSQKDDSQEFCEAINRISKFNFETTDPLFALIERAKIVFKELNK
jgi:predicted ATPase